jgi:hypothetical protein
LEERGAELMGVINAATAGLVQVIADALERDLWRGWGINTPEHWAGLRFGLSRHRARRLVAAARALAALPEVRAAFTAGELSEDHVAVIARAGVTARLDGQVAELARSATVSQLRHALRWLPPAEPEPETPPEPEPVKDPEAETPADRDPAPAPPEPSGPRCSAWWGYGDDGTWSLHVTADVADGAALEKALAAAADALFRGRYGADADPMLRHKITNLDAVLHLAATGLDLLARDTNPARRPRDRWLINLHVRPSAAGHIHLGPAVPARVRDELCCDALVRRWEIDPAGTVNLGRIHRVVNPRLRTVIEHRDGGCRVPGCEHTRWLIIHHIRQWTDGGPHRHPQPRRPVPQPSPGRAPRRDHHRRQRRSRVDLRRHPRPAPRPRPTPTPQPTPTPGRHPPRPPHAPLDQPGRRTRPMGHARLELSHRPTRVRAHRCARRGAQGVSARPTRGSVHYAEKRCCSTPATASGPGMVSISCAT